MTFGGKVGKDEQWACQANGDTVTRKLRDGQDAGPMNPEPKSLGVGGISLVSETTHSVKTIVKQRLTGPNFIFLTICLATWHGNMATQRVTRRVMVNDDFGLRRGSPLLRQDGRQFQGDSGDPRRSPKNRWLSIGLRPFSRGFARQEPKLIKKPFERPDALSRNDSGLRKERWRSDEFKFAPSWGSALPGKSR